MILKDILKVIHYLQDVQILMNENNENNEADEILFEGLASSVPWTYADMKLDNNSGDGESTFAFVDEKGNAIIGIYIKED